MIPTASHAQTPRDGHRPSVSVIMAAYNAAATIGRAVTSLRNQTFTDWELIAVDDGSSDSTGELLDRYALEDRRIRAVHQPNAGVAAVRRRGVELAQGEYIIHFDSDDYAEPGMLADMTAEARRSGADITVADFFTDSPSRGTAVVAQRRRGLSDRDLTGALLDGSLHGSLCNKLIRSDAYRRFGVDFSEGLTFGEDMLAVMKMIDAGASVTFVGKAYYHYCYSNPSSLTSRPGMESYLRRKQWIAECEKYAGSRYAGAISRRKFNAKFFALIHGLCDRKEFYAYGPNGPRWLGALTGNRKYRPGMLLASIGLFGAGRLWCRAVNRLTR